MLKERTVANVLRPIFAVLMVFLFIYTTTCFVIRGTFLSKSFWRDVVFGENVRKELYVLIENEIKENGDDYEGMEEGINELAMFMLDESLNTVFEKDYKVDYDRFEEIYEDYFQSYLQDEGASRNEIKELKGDLYDKVVEAVDDIRESIGDGVNGAILTAQLEIVYYGTFGLIFIVAFEVVLFVIHRNKFKPIRTLGISMTISEGLCFLGYLIIGLIFVAAFQAASKAENEEGYEDLVTALVGNLSKGIFIICLITGILLIIGIVLIVVGCILTGKKNKKYAEEHPELAKPVQQPMKQVAMQYQPVYQPQLQQQGYQPMYQQQPQQYQPQYQQPMQPQYQQGYQQPMMQQQYQQGYQQPMQQPMQQYQPQYQQQVQPVIQQQPIMQEDDSFLQSDTPTEPQYSAEGLPIYQSNNMPYNQGYSNQVAPATDIPTSSSNSSSDHYDWDEELE